LPDFPGARAVEDALSAGVETTGVTVHYVDEGLDTGAVIRQEPVPVEPRTTLLERIHAVEHRLLSELVNELCARCAPSSTKQVSSRSPAGSRTSAGRSSPAAARPT